MDSSGPDYYQVLGVPPDAPITDILIAYRSAVRACWLAQTAGDSSAGERLAQVDEAFEVLGDAERRRAYHQARDLPLAAPERVPERPSRPAPAATKTEPARPVTPSLPARGHDIEHPLEVPLVAAYLGGAMVVHVSASEPCGLCGGGGLLAGNRCGSCQGTGRVTVTRRIEVQIPAGVEQNTRVRMRGLGMPGPANTPPGDLYLVVRLQPDPRFERHGDDLTTDVDIDLITALLGGEVPVEKPDGRHLMLTIPPETQQGRVFRLSGQGMPRRNGAGRGDLLVRARVILPLPLPPGVSDMLGQLRDQASGKPMTPEAQMQLREAIGQMQEMLAQAGQGVFEEGELVGEARENVEDVRRSLLSRILAVGDSIDRLAGHEAVRADPDLRRQARMASWQIGQLLESEGVTRIETVGRPVDPLLHNVTAQEPNAQVSEGIIFEEIRPGYLIGVNVLRAAQVRVSLGPPPPE